MSFRLKWPGVNGPHCRHCLTGRKGCLA